MGCLLKSKKKGALDGLMLAALMILTAGSALADQPGLPTFYHDVSTFDADTLGMTSLRVATQISFDELQFVMDGDRFKAEYELAVSVVDEQGYQVDQKTVKRTHVVDEFELTNLSTLDDVVEVVFDVPPDDYDVNIQIEDLESRLASHRKIQVPVPDYSRRPLDVSGLVFTSRAVDDSAGAMIPLMSVLADLNPSQRSLFLLFEIYNRSEMDSVKVRYRIVNYKKKSLLEREFYALLEGYRIRVRVEISREELGAGRYALEMEVGEGKGKIERSKEFSVHWADMPRFIADLDKAVEQMHYLVKGKTLKKMKRAKGDEKERVFREFWDALDPDPKTKINEFMEEYYRRVAYSNEHFRSQREGWRTDRGMVYITLGPPENIERQPFNLDSQPYEVWHYYRVNRYLLFVDERGFGDYRLQSRSTFQEILNELK